ncbi:polyprenyl synthetase family protein [Pikeienuella sp. HZG-20]|uniref:polyprenyl synthetase family protein n=1 Tax=Paludibacillus litoralis TaxID=3133267 RepID=UPI0030EE8C3D
MTEDAFSRLASLVAPELEAVNQTIRERMRSEHAPRIPELSAHLIEAGGKRLRPVLTLAAAKLCGYEGEHQIRLAAAVEFIHTATLLHDDVVDESAKRRGRPTANILFGNQQSVLVGDYLFARSFRLMVETGSLRVLDILAGASAVIAEGEVLQLTAQHDLSGGEERYFQVIRGKTAALFAAAAEVGAVVAAADEAEIAALRSYGDALGVAFQLIDDCLDYDGAAAAMGKNVGDDFRDGKATLPVLIAYRQGDAAERAFWERVIGDHEQKEGDLAEALSLIAAHDGLGRTRARAAEWGEKAVRSLDQFADGDVKRGLADVVEFVTARAR